MTAAVLPLDEPEFWQDPYPAIAHARCRGRVARSPEGEIVLLAIDDAEAASARPEFATLGVAALDRLGMTDGPFRRWRALSLNAQDGDDHVRLRSLVGRAFSPRQVERVRRELALHAQAVVMALGDAEVEVHRDLGGEIPRFSICTFLGIPVEDRARIEQFMVGTEEGFSVPMTADKQARADGGIVALYEYVGELVDRRRAAPGDDLVSALISVEADGDRLSTEELLAMVVNLIGGAVGSSDAGIANLVELMATEPVEVQQVREDPALVEAFVEELLRYRPPFRSTRRKAVRDLDIAGEHLRAGDTLIISRQAANRDPERFVDPDVLRIRRPRERHASFGYGAHFCLGQALARLNLAVVAEVLVARWEHVELCEMPRRVPFGPTERFESLRVRPHLARR
jgi:cytochrome P450